MGLWESAAELYDATTPLAQRIGQSDIEIGASAGAGLCLLELGRLNAARGALADVQARMETRPDWFQGREIAEALAIRIDAADGQFEKALGRAWSMLSRSLKAADLYNAAWLTVACAEALIEFRSGPSSGMHKSLQGQSETTWIPRNDKALRGARFAVMTVTDAG